MKEHQHQHQHEHPALTNPDVVVPSFPEVVDSTMMSTAASCSQKFFNEYILCLTSKGFSIDLLAGGAFAHALESIRRDFYENKLSLEECYVQAFPKFVQFWGDISREPKKDNYKDFTNTWGAVRDYFEVYPPATDVIQPYISPEGKYGVEFTFAIPLEVLHPVTNQPILYGGRFDLLGYYNDMVVVVDEKTTKSIGKSWGFQWDMRGQFIGYTFASRQHGFNCAGALIRGIAIQQTQFKHAQTVVEYSKWQLERWYNQINERVSRLVGKYKRMQDVFTQETISISKDPAKWHAPWDYSYGEACTQYGNCTFMKQCTTREPWLYYSDFDRRVWNPLHKNPTHEEKTKLPDDVIILNPEDFA